MQQNSGALAGAGAVSGIAASKVVDKIKETAEFVPYLKVETLEVCYVSKERPGYFRCILTQCNSEKFLCERYITEDTAKNDVDNLKAVVINIKGWARFISAVEAKIKEDPEGVRQIYEDYNQIDKLLIIGGDE